MWIAIIVVVLIGAFLLLPIHIIFGNSQGKFRFVVKVSGIMSDEDFLVYYDKEEMDNFEKEEFRKDGLKEGLEQGRTEGLEQGQKTIIQNMINNGITISEISKMINISEEEINNLLN